MILWLISTPCNLPAQQPYVQSGHRGIMPPGAIGCQQLQRSRPLPEHFQLVKISGPPGSLVSIATEDHFGELHKSPLRADLLVGQSYRLRVTNIPTAPGMEVFPTVELTSRLHPPQNERFRFPVPIELTLEDLHTALTGKFVTRVVYLENPLTALPVDLSGRKQNWFDVGPGKDPFVVAKSLGRPMAVVRMGGRLPKMVQGSQSAEFNFGSPPAIVYPPSRKDSTTVKKAPLQKVIPGRPLLQDAIAGGATASQAPPKQNPLTPKESPRRLPPPRKSTSRGAQQWQ